MKVKEVKYFGDYKIKVVNSSTKVSNQKDLSIFYDLIKDIKDCKMLDIGANKGYYALLTTIKPDLYCYSFEPLSNVYRNFLLKNVALNKVEDKCRCYPFGLSDKDMMANLWVDMNTENATLAEDKEFHKKMIEKRKQFPKRAAMGYFRYKSVPAEFHRLDDIMTKVLRNPKIDVVKVDVEGAEHLVLEGGKTFFKKQTPILFIEIEERHCRRFDTSIEETLKKIKKLGYKNITNAGINYICTK